MIRWAVNYFSGISPIFIDGLLFCGIAWFIFSQAYLGGDEASKFLSPAEKFWINFWVGSGASICGALKMFRSTAYGTHVEEKEKAKRESSGGTQPPFKIGT